MPVMMADNSHREETVWKEACGGLIPSLNFSQAMAERNVRKDFHKKNRNAITRLESQKFADK